MKLAYFDDYRLGVVTAGGIVDVGDELRDVPRRAPEDLMAASIARMVLTTESAIVEKKEEEKAAAGHGHGHGHGH